MRNIAEKMLDNTHFPRASRGFRGKITNFVSFFALSNCAAKNNRLFIRSLQGQTAQERSPCADVLLCKNST
jgi:hypothetical protein